MTDVGTGEERMVELKKEGEHADEGNRRERL